MSTNQKPTCGNVNVQVCSGFEGADFAVIHPLVHIEYVGIQQYFKWKTIHGAITEFSRRMLSIGVIEEPFCEFNIKFVSTNSKGYKSLIYAAGEAPDFTNKAIRN